MPIPIMAIAALAMAGAKVYKGISDKNKASKIEAMYKPYEASQYAVRNLQGAQQAMAGRMAGASSEERNIDVSEAGYNNYLDRNASSGSQKLALAAAGVSQAQSAYSDLQTKEQQNKYGLMANLNQAYTAMIGEDNKVWQSKNQKYLQDINQKQALNSSGDQNIWGGISDGISIAAQSGLFNGKGAGDAGISGALMGSGGYANGAGSNFGAGWTGSNTSFQGPASAFGGQAPQYRGLNMWYPPLKQN